MLFRKLRNRQHPPLLSAKGEERDFRFMGEEEFFKNRVLDAPQSLISIFGILSKDYLESRHSPLSEKYDYAFRYGHTNNFIDKLK